MALEFVGYFHGGCGKSQVLLGMARRCFETGCLVGVSGMGRAGAALRWRGAAKRTKLLVVGRWALVVGGS